MDKIGILQMMEILLKQWEKNEEDLWCIRQKLDQKMPGWRSIRNKKSHRNEKNRIKREQLKQQLSAELIDIQDELEEFYKGKIKSCHSDPIKELLRLLCAKNETQT